MPVGYFLRPGTSRWGRSFETTITRDFDSTILYGLFFSCALSISLNGTKESVVYETGQNPILSMIDRQTMRAETNLYPTATAPQAAVLKEKPPVGPPLHELIVSLRDSSGLIKCSPERSSDAVADIVDRVTSGPVLVSHQNVNLLQWSS